MRVTRRYCVCTVCVLAYLHISQCMNSILHSESAFESIMHPNVRTNLWNHAWGEDTASYTERNCNAVAGIEGRWEDKREARYWAARGGSKSCHVVRFKVKHNHGTVTDLLNWALTENLRVSLSSHAAAVSERSTSLLFSTLCALNPDDWWHACSSSAVAVSGRK